MFNNCWRDLHFAVGLLGVLKINKMTKRKLHRYGRVKKYWNTSYTQEYYDVFYVSDMEDGRRSGYVYSILYEVDKWDEKDLPLFIEVDYKHKILKKFLNKEKKSAKHSTTKREESE